MGSNMKLTKEIKKSIRIADLETTTLDELLGRHGEAMNKILTMEELEKLPKDKQKELMLEWRESDLSNTEIVKAMGTTINKYNILVSKLDLPRKKLPNRSNSFMKENEQEVPVVEEKESSSVVPVINSDLTIYLDKIPHDLLSSEIHLEGYEIKGAIVCTNPEHVDKSKLIARVFSPDHVKQIFGTGSMVTVLYKRIEI